MREPDPRREERSEPTVGTGQPPTLRYGHVVRQGQRLGERYVHLIRPFRKQFARGAHGQLVARDEVTEPRHPLGIAYRRLRDLLIGRPIPTAHEQHERLSKLTALPIFAADALSSIAYGPEEILKVLVLAGVGALAWALPIGIVIILMLAILVVSYQQTIAAYPGGGGSYTVASENLGAVAGLVAAAALLTDYVLVVAVSSASGVTAMTSAFPDLYPYRLDLMIAAVVLVMLANLRGVRETGALFAAPAYAFILGIAVVIGLGALDYIAGAPILYAPPSGAEPADPRPLTLLLILTAFAQGGSALTGVEAVANGVPAFKPPESRNARTTLIWTGLLLGGMLLGISFLASWLGVVSDPTEQESLVSQITRTLAGVGPVYYFVQFSTALILVLAFNTSFADFPRLASILARHQFLPNQFAFRGERLAYNVGIVHLGAVAILLLWIFGGSVDRLIPLFAVGVYTAFTLSQVGMVQRWRSERGHGWRRKALVNGVGGLMTAVVVAVVAVTKFTHGAWMVIAIIPVAVALMLGIRHHYRALAEALALPPGVGLPPVPPAPQVVVAVGRVNRATLAAVAFARSISPDVRAVYVCEGVEQAIAYRQRWRELAPEVRLDVVESPYRALLSPLLAYIDAVDAERPGPVTVVLPEFVPRHWWEFLLHNFTALRLKVGLFFRPNTIVIDLPYHVGDE